MVTAALIRRTGALSLAATLGMLGASAPPASAQRSALPASAHPARTASARPAGAAVTAGRARQPRRADWSNVGAPHSPQLLRQLAGPAGGSGRTSQAAITGAIPGAAQGVDVASFQHPSGDAIDWSKVAAAGIRFAAVKATEGTYYTNPFALTDLAAAKAAGLSVIAYAFAIPNGNGGSKSAVAQADHLLGYLGASSRTVPIMLDIEFDPYHTNQCYGLTPAAMVSWVTAFDTEIHRKTGRLPVIYTPAPWWNSCTGSSTGFSQIPLWIPAYGATSPGLPAGWGNWSIWQYTSSGTVDGIETTLHTDLDQLNPGVVALLNPGHQHGVAGHPVGWRLTPVIGVPGPAPSFSARGLPPGVSVSARGLVSGWPDRAGTYRARVTATGSHGATGSVSFSWRVRRAPDRGAAGRVRLHKGGKCLHDAGNRSAGGTPVNIWRCNGGAAEQWTAVQDDTLRIHGKCLAAPGMAKGARAELRSCSGSAAQQWLAGSRGRLINPASGLCLADPGGRTRNGTRVRLRACTGHAAQQWTLPAGPVASQLPGRCLDDRGNGRTSGNPVDLAACNGSAAQTWRARPDGTLRIHSKCLAVSRSGAVSGTPVDLRTCTGGRVKWRMVADRGGVSLVNPASGLCLADPGDARASGTRLAVLTCSASDPGMAWRVH
jgi:GH25 family lysozyme M1 (1,4-beta-N-acetylmuramidase)